MVKIRVFALTKLGKKVTSSRANGSDEISVLQFIRENKTATEDELDAVGGERFVLRKLKSEGLVKELTD